MANDSVSVDSSTPHDEDRAAISVLYERSSDAANRAALSLLAVAIFCLFTILGAADRSLIAPEPSIAVPLLNVSMSFAAFLIIAPLLLIVLLIHVHVLFGHWLELDAARRRLSLPATAVTLFSLDRRWARLLTTLLFYWLVPFVLATFAWKAGGSLAWIDLSLITGVVTFRLLLCLISRSRASGRGLKNTLRIVTLALVALSVLVLPLALWIWINVIARAYLDPASFQRLTLQGQSWRRPLNLFRDDFKGAWLPGTYLRGADIRFGNLEEAELTSAMLAEARLSRANFTRATLSRAVLVNADLKGANLHASRLDRANLSGAKLNPSLTEAPHSWWSFPTWRYAPLVADRVANLAEANLTRVVAVEAWLDGADLTGAILVEADLTGASLRNAILVGANLAGAILSPSVAGPKHLEGWPYPFLLEGRRVNLTGANLRDAILIRAILFNANITNGKLHGATLIQANLTQASLVRAVLTEAVLIEADLSRADLTGADLRHAVLAGANLSGADLSGATLMGSDLTDVDLSGAKGLTQTQIRGAKTLRNTKLPEELSR